LIATIFRVVPEADAADIDLADEFAGEADLRAVDARDIHRRGRSGEPMHGGELEELFLLRAFRRRRAKSDAPKSTVPVTRSG